MKHFIFPASLLVCFSLVFFNSSCAQQDSLDFKIGQMIMIGFPKAEVDSAVLAEVAAGKVGAVIFFEKNIPKSNSFAGLKKIAWTYQKAAPVPILIGIDQEGGRVNRLKEKYGFTRSVTAGYIGKTGSLDTARFYADATAATLSGLGINVNFAPCVDLAVNPSNTVIVKVERSYSKNADSVTRFAREVILQHRKHNVLTTLKHFPGHGSSKEDTHFGVADVTDTWSEEEIKPYRDLLASGHVDAVMTSHIVNKKLDPKGLPGTLSARVIDSLLRKKIGFNGVVFTDDMQMHAITKYFGTPEAIRLSILAGVDIMCFSNNIQGSEERTADKVHQIIRQYVDQGIITRERIEESYRRITALKKKLTSNDTMRLENKPAPPAQQSKSQKRKS
ncbi:MAG: glycoside hydrolase family 3 protein [Bacteroidetes bacterium]|nr:glycoside hydrolase family 3 protein [Bacteroidota bacterium]